MVRVLCFKAFQEHIVSVNRTLSYQASSSFQTVKESSQTSYSLILLFHSFLFDIRLSVDNEYTSIHADLQYVLFLLTHAVSRMTQCPN